MNYLFLGDLVDRRFNSFEIFLLLLAFKVRFSDRITIYIPIFKEKEEIMSPDKLHIFMDFNMNFYVNMALQRFGEIAQMFLTI